VELSVPGAGVVPVRITDGVFFGYCAADVPGTVVLKPASVL
jgi:hypothetical protein